TSPKVIAIARDVSECHAQLALMAPSMGDALIPALDLACSAIGQGESSRLYQSLVKETKLAIEAHLGLTATTRCGRTSLSLVATSEKLEPALREALKIVQEFAKNGIEDRELERVKSSLEAEVVGGKETVEGYARRLGYYYCQFGNPDYEKKYLEQIFA